MNYLEKNRWPWVVMGLAVGALIAVLFYALFFWDVKPAYGIQDNYNVRICHAIPPDTAANGLVSNHPANIGVLIGHATQHDADIIPPFGQFPGKNWTDEGEATWNNDCVRPPRDLCENLDGIQSELPPYYEAEQGQCSCAKGYHAEEYGDNHEYIIPECVPDAPDLPPTPTPPQENRVEAPSTPSASSCSDSKPGNVANINVVTTGNRGELEIQWTLPTGG